MNVKSLNAEKKGLDAFIQINVQKGFVNRLFKL